MDLLETSLLQKATAFDYADTAPQPLVRPAPPPGMVSIPSAPPGARRPRARGAARRLGDVGPWPPAAPLAPPRPDPGRPPGGGEAWGKGREGG